MAFDLKTAKPVSGGFDLRTAKPVGKPRPAPPPKKPEETSFLRDLADVAISGGRAIVDLAKPFAYMAQQGAPTSILPVIAGTVLGESEELLKRGRSAADIQREQIRQRTIAEEAKAPGALARGLSGARQFIEGPQRPAAAQTPLSGIADFISPARAIASLLPATPEAAQREVSGVTTQFGSPIEAAQFFTSQAPATLATIGAGGISRAGALAQGLERAAATKAAQQAAVRTGTTLNATDAGYSAAQDVLAKGGTQEEANRAFTIAATGAALTSAAASKIPGVEQNVFATRPTAPGILRGAARTAVGEAPQEFVEEAGAQLAQNIAKLGTAAETPISEGVLSSGALGLIGGAGIGAGSGAIQGMMQRGEAPPAAAVPPAAEPIRTVTITYPDKEDPSKVVTRNLDVLSEPDEQGFLKARDGTGKVIDIKADDLAELEAASPAYVAQEAAPTPLPTPVVDPATIRERLRLASGVTGDQNEPPRVRALVNDVATALAEDNPVAAQAAVQSRQRALAEGRMSEATRAQRQAELDEALSIINDYRAEYGRARAAEPARVAAPMAEPESVEQALEQNTELAARDAEAQAKRDAEEQARLRLESALESASLVGQGSPARQAQTERQQIFDAIINDETIENPAAAFRQALRERGYPKPELNANERRQVQARLAFTKPAAIAPYIGEEITPEVIEPQPEPAPIIEGEFTEVPAPPPPTPPEVVAGAAPAQPSPRARLMAGAAIEPGVPAIGIGEPPAPSRMAAGLGGEPQVEADFEARREAREEARQRLIDELEALGFKDITVFVRDLLEGGKASGTYDPMDSIIRVAMSPDGEIMTSVMYHELIHYLKDHGFFTDAEWNAILKFAKRDLVMRGIIEYEYRGKTRADKNEEIVAEAFRSWMSQAKGFQPANSVYAKIRRFLNAIRDFFFSQDLRDAEAVFEAIRNGEFAAREDKGSAKRAAYFAGTAEMPGRQRMYAGVSITEPREGDSEDQTSERRIIADNYEVAQRMEEAGADPMFIRLASGWERNPYDNQWRYLVPDNRAFETQTLSNLIDDVSYYSDLYEGAQNSDGTYPLNFLMDHPDLYAVYPEASEIRVLVKPSKKGSSLRGSYDPDTKSITLYTGGSDPVGTLLHEVQHWVQDKEGFAFGSSASTVWSDLSPEQKADEAKTTVATMTAEIDIYTDAENIVAWLRGNMPRGGLGMDPSPEDLQDILTPYLEENPWTSDEAVDAALEAILGFNMVREAFGSDPVNLRAAELSSIERDLRSEINDRETMIETVKSGDVNDEASPAAKIVRQDFEGVIGGRAATRYQDTAGEIEARDVTKSRGLTQEGLRYRGMLSTERQRTPKEVVVTYPERGKKTESRGTPTVPPATNRGADLTFISRLSQRMKDLYRKLAYKYVAAPNLDKQLAEALGVDQLPKQFSLEDRMSMFESMRNGMLRDFEQTWLRPFLAALEKSGIHPNDLATYLWARSAADRNAMIAERNRDMPDGGSGMTNLEAEAILAHYRSSGLMRQMEPLVKMHDQLVDWMLKQRIKSGLMSKEEADLLREQQPYYTPLKGFAADGDMQTSGDESPHQDYKGRAQMGVRPTDYIKATGRSSMPFNPMYNLIADAMRLTQRVARNDVGKRFLSIVQDFPDLLGDAVKVYTDDRPKIVKKGIAPPGSKKKTVGPMNMAANANKFLVVKEGGKNYYIEFDETTKDGEELKRMFDNMTPGEIDGAVGWLVKLGQFRKQLLTRFSPVFWAMNFGRDVMDMLVTAYSEKTRTGSPVEGKAVALRTLNNLRKPSTWRSVWKYVKGTEPQRAEDIDNYLLISQMIADGGNSGYNEALTAEELGKKIDRQLSVLKGAKPDSLWGKANDKRAALVEAVDDINDFAGIILRFAAYKAAIDQGTPRDDAAKFALDSTLNLSRKGEATPTVDNIWIFTNPAIQSLEKKKRIYSSKNGRKAMAAMMALGIGLHFWNMAVAGDDDDDGENNYQDMDEGTKMVNLVIYPPSGGEPVKIPVGFMVGFEVYLGQQIARMISDDGSGISALRAMGNAMSAFVATQLPAGEKIGSITDLPKMVIPDFFTPVVDLWRNENYFGSQIYPEPYYEGQAVSGMARRSTGEFYKNLAMALNRAGGGTEDIASKTDVPAEGMKYLVDQYLLLGGAALPKDAAKFFEEGAPADLTKIPVAKRFVGDNSEYAAQNKFYDRAAKVEIISGQYKGENADARAYAESKEEFPVESNPAVIKAYKDASKKLRELSKAKREAQRSGGAGMEQKLERVEQDQKKVYEKFNRVYNDVKGRQ